MCLKTWKLISEQHLTRNSKNIQSPTLIFNFTNIILNTITLTHSKQKSLHRIFHMCSSRYKVEMVFCSWTTMLLKIYGCFLTILEIKLWANSYVGKKHLNLISSLQDIQIWPTLYKHLLAGLESELVFWLPGTGFRNYNSLLCCRTNIYKYSMPP